MENILHTTHGDINLASPSDIRKIKKIALQLQRTTEALTRKDIADWRAAWQLAINVENPNRQRLYDIYRDVAVDLHLSGCVAQREGFILAKSFKIVDNKGKAVEEALHFFDQAWFKNLILHCIEANFYGHSLVELGELTTDGDGCIAYSNATLIPRQHVIPEYHRVIPHTGMHWKEGIDYRLPPYSEWIIEAGEPNDLGLFLKAATQTIPKKNMLAFWDTFGEIFGMPMRIAKTTSRDEKEIQALDTMLRDSGSKLSIVAPVDTEIEFIESAKSDAFNVYDRRIGRANTEISKLIIGQTMTIEDGSSLSQSQTHLQVFQNIINADADRLRDIINNQLLPRMVRHGFPLKGLRFEWDDTVDYTPEQQRAIEQTILQAYDIDPAYFLEKYGIPCHPKENTPVQNLARQTPFFD